jgi:ADP-ribosylglycohydrolase
LTEGITRHGELAMRLVGGVWGHLVGDAMGVPYEFREPDQIGEIRWAEQGTHHQYTPDRDGRFDVGDTTRRALMGHR